MKILIRLLTIGLAASIAALPVHAQTIRASIYGRVLDGTGAPIPAARVTATHVATGTSSSFVTDELGNYDFPRLLNFGEYRLEAEAPGFQRLVREGITLVVDQRALVELSLSVGNVAETVEVHAEAPPCWRLPMPHRGSTSRISRCKACHCRISRPSTSC